MKTPLNFLVSLSLAILSLFCLMQIAAKLDISISNIELSSNGQTTKLIKLPLSQNITGNYEVTMDVRLASWASKTLQIIPDDELLAIKINGNEISLDDFSKGDLRNYTKGIKIHLADLEVDQTNHLQLILKNSSNPAGLNIKSINTIKPIALCCIFIALLILVYGVSRHLRLTWAQLSLLIAGLTISLIYLSLTDPTTRTFDVYEGGGHRDYVEYLIAHQTTPPPGEGWEYHQPPLYYTIAALSKSILSGTTLYSDAWGQLLALWFWTIFLMASLGALTISVKKSYVLCIASAAICFWPAGVIHSIRIGNDLPLYAFYALSFYYCLRWWNLRSLDYLLYASIWASMALLTKSNALAIWGVIGVLFLVEMYRLWIHRGTRALKLTKLRKGLVITIACFSTTIALNFGDNIWHYIDGTSSDWLLSNVSQSIHSGLKVANNPSNYLIFDTATYLQYPFISSWEDEYGRQYFWNFVLRSALTSEFFFHGEAFQIWGIANGIFLLMLLGGIATYTIQQHTLMGQRQWIVALYNNLPWLLAVLMPFLLLLAYRIKLPLACNTDFRYIYPVLIPLIFFSTKVWNYFPYFKLSWLLALGTPLIAVSTWVLLMVV